METKHTLLTGKRIHCGDEERHLIYGNERLTKKTQNKGTGYVTSHLWEVKENWIVQEIDVLQKNKTKTHNAKGSWNGSGLQDGTTS